LAENYTPTGATAAAIERFTSAEAATGTFGTMMRTFHTEIADRTRFLATTGLLAFPATQVTSADANTLDDYEEGTWTPALVCGTSGTITLSTATGTYTKVGRLVTIHAITSVSAVSSPLGTLTMSGLPFTVGAYSAISVNSGNLSGTSTQSVQGYANLSTTNIVLARYVGGVVAADLASVVQNTTEIIIGGVFRV
jgi:hypothetical protein